MRVRTLQTLLILALLLQTAPPAQAAEPNEPAVVLSAFTEGNVIEGRLGLRNATGLEGGIQVGWYEEQPETIWSVGLYAHYLVTPNVQLPIGNLIPGNPFDLPETLSADIYLGANCQVCNLDRSQKDTQTESDAPFIQAGPLVGTTVGPVAIEYQYRIQEGGGHEISLTEGGVVQMGVILRF